MCHSFPNFHFLFFFFAFPSIYIYKARTKTAENECLRRYFIDGSIDFGALFRRFSALLQCQTRIFGGTATVGGSGRVAVGVVLGHFGPFWVRFRRFWVVFWRFWGWFRLVLARNGLGCGCLGVVVAVAVAVAELAGCQKNNLQQADMF
jgi:hypothetical protein